MMAEAAREVKTTDPTQWALRERVKELTCLYGIAQVADRTDIPLQEVIGRVVSFLPVAWQYPECACARVWIDGSAFLSEAFQESAQRLAANVVVATRNRGQVEVFYRETKPLADEGPFLKEERSLINEVARQVSLMLERREASEANARLEEQLRHADRLATIGRLAAGVAHELNEPLGAILGFAQLTQGNFGIPDQTGRDLEKIVRAALRAREIVKKLLIFARQTPAERVPVDINRVVRDGLFLLTTRCAKAGIAIDLHLPAHLPAVEGDPGLLQQVVVNLAVNGIQAMPRGGTLTLTTGTEGESVLLAVQDSGEGMTEAVRRHVFTPFFTTKEVGQGTGLGLPVVHGIVTAHGGQISLQSEAGKGTRVRILLPLAGAPSSETETHP
jgi:two-component system, NtrC family, sensor kinase